MEKPSQENQNSQTPEKKQYKAHNPRKDFKKRYQPREKARYALSCGAIIFRFDKGIPFYLLLKYPTKKPYWGFVKGNVEPGETEEETLNREAAEEAGLYDVKMIPHFRETQHYFYRYEGKLIRKDAVYFLAKVYDWKVKISHEHLDYKWVPYEEALEVMKIRATRELLTKAHIFIKNHLEQLQLF